MFLVSSFSHVCGEQKTEVADKNYGRGFWPSSIWFHAEIAWKFSHRKFTVWMDTSWIMPRTQILTTFSGWRIPYLVLPPAGQKINLKRGSPQSRHAISCHPAARALPPVDPPCWDFSHGKAPTLIPSTCFHIHWIKTMVFSQRFPHILGLILDILGWDS